MSEHQASVPDEVVDESVSHYKIQKLESGKIRLRAGGHVVQADTYFQALERYAKTKQQEYDEKPDHLRQRRYSCSHDVSHPETLTEHGLPVVFAKDTGGTIHPLRVADTLEAAERVLRKFGEEGCINTPFEIESLWIERVPQA